VKALAWTALSLICASPALSQQTAAAQIAEAGANATPRATDVLDRLAALLEGIPKTWDSLPPPLVPVSGRPVEEVLAAASEEQSRHASQWLARLASIPPAARSAAIQAAIRDRAPTEVDLWLPGPFAPRTRRLDDAAVLEAWMQWTETLGRKDALLTAASVAIDLLRTRLGAPRVLAIIPFWAVLPPAAGAERSQALLQLSVAEVYFRAGENEKALDAYRTARQLFVAAGDQLGQGETWRGEAEVHSRRGEKERAHDSYVEARSLIQAARQLVLARPSRQRKPTAWEQVALGRGWYAEAESRLWLGEYGGARFDYEEARKLFVSAGDQLGQAKTWHGEAAAFLRLDDDQRALDAYRTARKLFTAVGDNAGLGDAWFGEATVWIRSSIEVRRAEGAAKAAIKAYQRAGVVREQVAALLFKASFEQLRPRDPVMTALGSLLGDWLPSSKPFAKSASAAIDLFPESRKIWLKDSDRIKQEGAIRAAYDQQVPVRARERGQAEEALRLAEEARSRALLDLLGATPDGGEHGPAAGLTEERQRLETELSRIEEELRGAPMPQRQQELRAKRSELDEDLERNRFQSIAAQEESFTQEHTLDTLAIRGLAGETGPVLLYYVSGSEVWGFLILPGTAKIFLRSITISRTELGREIRAFSRDLANPLFERRAEAWAFSLWNRLIAPFSDRLPAGGPLVLVPHGPLHELPFEALRDVKGRRLFERWQVSITPSASALALARRRHAEPLASDSFLGFSSGRGLSLPAGEVALIAGLFAAGEAAYQPTAATYQNYVDLVAQARQLLIATRGVHHEGSGTETYLEIEATQEVHDGRLTAAEIATIPLRAELVTLAACDTSHGRALLSDERLDLTRSFLIARAAAVLATRWKVPEDAATSRFLADFYRAYRHGGPGEAGLRKDEALTEARRRSRERGDPAQVWAAWVLVGDAR
jgi:CHAT domain-containing protein